MQSKGMRVQNYKKIANKAKIAHKLMFRTRQEDIFALPLGP